MLTRPAGISARLKLALAFTLVGAIAAFGLLAVTLLFALRYVPEAPLQELQGPWAPSRRDIERAFWPMAWLAFAGVVVCSFAGGWLLAGRLLRPLERMNEVATLVSSGTYTARVNLAGPSDEFRSVADALDTMLDSVQSHVDVQRRFAANASHELRTPLAATRAVIEVAQASASPDTAETFATLQRLNDRATNSTNALLLLARLDNEVPELVAVDLSLAVEEALDALHTVADAYGVAVTLDADPVTVLADPALAERVAANLIQNAIVHNRDGGKVAITVSQSARGVMLRVTNTGAVIDSATLATLTEPFARGSRARSESHAGAGLGLALCATIMRAHGGELELFAPATGGLDARAWFQAA